MANPTTNLAMTLPVSEQDAQKVATYNAAFQILDALFGAGSGAWTSVTPTLTNAAIGTGGGAAATLKYMKIGRLVICRLFIKLGTSGASVSGLIEFALPVTAATYSGVAGAMPMGNAASLDSSDSNKVYPCSLAFISTTLGGILARLASGTYSVDTSTSSTVPFTWASGDEIHATFIYESAA